LGRLPKLITILIVIREEAKIWGDCLMKAISFQPPTQGLSPAFSSFSPKTPLSFQVFCKKKWIKDLSRFIFINFCYLRESRVLKDNERFLNQTRKV
jgi:hypothetical protein